MQVLCIQYILGFQKLNTHLLSHQSISILSQRFIFHHLLNLQRRINSKGQIRQTSSFFPLHFLQVCTILCDTVALTREFSCWPILLSCCKGATVEKQDHLFSWMMYKWSHVDWFLNKLFHLICSPNLLPNHFKDYIPRPHLSSDPTEFKSPFSQPSHSQPPDNLIATATWLLSLTWQPCAAQKARYDLRH